MAQHLQILLDDAAKRPDSRLDQLAVLSQAEHDNLIVRWNATGKDYPQDAPFPQLFESQVKRTPDAVAVAFQGQQLTYAQLNAAANRLAHHLHKLGIAPDRRVGLCIERSPDMVLGILGILKAGGAYVPLDPDLPPRRVAFLIQDAGLSVVLTQQRLLDRLPLDGTRAICLDKPEEEISHESPENPNLVLRPEHLAYVLYTSGSTGAPKGVMVEHRGLTHYLNWCLATYTPLGDGGAPLHSSIAFDLSLTALLAPLVAGQRVLLVPPAVGVEGLSAALRDHGPFCLVKLTPAHLRLLATELTAADARRVGALVIGGEALMAADIAFWRQAAPLTALFNEYGPTEAVVGCCVYRVSADDTGSVGAIPIGKPIHNTQLYVLDRRMRPAPIGVVGELYIGGVGLARGYLGRADLTAERFVPDPFGPLPGGRLYRTGDLVRHLASGELDYLGRGDGQVKVRGYRVELGEVEAALASHAAVRECVVLCREDSPGDRRLVGYVASRDEMTAAELRAHARTRLPEYMVPAAVVVMERLPLTANGKIDRRALPAPEASRAAVQAEYAAPRGPVEEAIAGVWSEVLGVPRVGIEDNFFDLGGHSLLAAQVVSRLSERLGLDLPLRVLFETPTVPGVAQAALGAMERGRPSLLPPLEVPTRTPDSDGVVRLPVSFAQTRLWFLDRLEPGSPQYNIPAAVRLTGPLDVEALRGTLQEIVQRHEALRTTFALGSDGPVQVIHAAGDASLPVEDLTSLSGDERQARVERRVSEEARRPFDLSRGPLLRALLLRLGESEHVAVVTMHHIVSDGWSVGVLLRELLTLYPAMQRGLPSPLPALPVQYADYALWQRSYLQGELLQRQVGYWKQKLSNVPDLDLATDRPRQAVAAAESAVVPLNLPAELMTRLWAVARDEGASLFMVLLAGLQTVLGRYSGQEDFAIGSPVAGRNRRELEGLVGFFVNTLVLRADLSGQPSFRELLRRVRQVCLDAYAHQDVPFERLVEELQPRRDAGRSPFFQVMLALDNPGNPEASLPGLEVRPVPAVSGAAKFDLTLQLAETAAGVRGEIEYRTDLWDADTITRFAGHLRVLLEGVAAEPDTALSRLALLLPDEQVQVLGEFNATSEGYGPVVCLHRKIADQLQRTPDAIAVSFEGRVLSCRELDLRANRLAQHLRLLGVGPGALVGVCAERSVELVVALLGVLKSGAAYVPLDPGYPPERLAFMLEDSAVSVLLTQERLLESLPPHQARVVCLDRDWPQVAQQPAEEPHSGVTPAHAAYMIYTSGSTGRPKGALNSHQGIVNRLLWMQQQYRLGTDDVVLQKTPFSFDVSVWEFFWPLLTGARLAVAKPGGHQDPVYLAQTIARERVTTLHFVPPMLQVFLETPGLESSCAGVRRVICSGEALPLALQQRFYARMPWAELHNLYGPTEAAVDVCDLLAV
jgi:amino acid adenylation domain-containing protein